MKQSTSHHHHCHVLLIFKKH